MATFAKSAFNTASYAAFRPVYPESLYKFVLQYHRGPKRLCVDLGCGPGIVTRKLSKQFDKTIGIDPSGGMIRQAREGAQQDSSRDIEFWEGSAETGTAAIDAGSVDLVVAAQAAHWFDQAKLWPEMQRIMRTGGTLAFWGYKDHVFVDYPHATEVMQRYAYDQHPDKLGSYWPQPGRSILQDQLRAIKPPEEDWEDIDRELYEPDTKGPYSGDGKNLMAYELSVGSCKSYVRTWSSYHGWAEAHPDAVARDKGGKGDIMDEMFDEIAKKDKIFRDDTFPVNVEWGSAVIRARKRGGPPPPSEPSEHNDDLEMMDVSSVEEDAGPARPAGLTYYPPHVLNARD
ncbi:trans-aconitate methyltransferase 1 [Oleoguttula sp. CCFEE 5521]